MPLYVVRAQAMTLPEVTSVVIKRRGKDPLVLESGTREFDETLIYPGDEIEFTSSLGKASPDGFVYVGGKVNKAGRYGLVRGMTLTQAIMTAGGVSEEKVKKAVIRRKNGEGFLKSKSYKLSDIIKGKIADPVLERGDMVQVGG